MSIHCSIEPQIMTKDEYHYLDREVMGIIFSIQNELGRLFDEKKYIRKPLGIVVLKQGWKLRQKFRFRWSIRNFQKGILLI